MIPKHCSIRKKIAVSVLKKKSYFNISIINCDYAMGCKVIKLKSIPKIIEKIMKINLGLTMIKPNKGYMMGNLNLSSMIITNYPVLWDHLCVVTGKQHWWIGGIKLPLVSIWNVKPPGSVLNRPATWMLMEFSWNATKILALKYFENSNS